MINRVKARRDVCADFGDSFFEKKPCVLLDVSAKCMKLLLLLGSSKNWTHAARMSYVGF